MIRRLVFMAALAALAACTSTTTTQTIGTGEAPVATSGECNVEGFDCSAAGAPCVASCYPSDTKKDAYVSLLVGDTALDSRAVAFDPVESGDRTLRYGCGLFTLSDGRAGLEILYRENDVGSAFEHDATIRIDGFRGPGAYLATVRYTPSEPDQLAGRIYAKKSGCAIDVASGEQGGIRGAISCASVPSAKDGSVVAITGEFACGGTALSPILCRLP